MDQNTNLAVTEAALPTELAPAAESEAPAADNTPVKNKKKKEKRSLSRSHKIALGVAGGVVGLLAAAAGVMFLISNSGKVNVYNVSEFAMYESMVGGEESYGFVSAENVQTVFVSDTLRVKEIFVEDGQKVKKGDLLLTYDTTLDSIEVDKKALEVTQKQLELANLKKQLAEINTYRPSSPSTAPSTPSKPTEEPSGDLVTTYTKLEGTGTEDDPFIYVIAGSEIPCDEAFVTALLAGSDDVWVVFERRTGNMTGGSVQEAWGIRFTQKVTGNSLNFFDASSYVDDDADDDSPAEDPGSGFTAVEIARMKAEVNKQIAELDLEIRIAQVNVAQMRLELASGEVYSEVDGVVVRNFEDENMVSGSDMFFDDTRPLLKVNGGGGFYVDGSISELDLSSISVGDTVSVMSWESGWTYDGVITEIFNLPNGDMNYGGAVASYYPFTVFVDESADFQQNEYVSIKLGSSSGEEAFYVESAFVRTENGQSYVYAKNEKGLLEKRELATGGTLWGSYTQVYSGLSMDDYVAFPYGRKVREGAKTKDAGMSELWEGIY